MNPSRRSAALAIALVAVLGAGCAGSRTGGPDRPDSSEPAAAAPAGTPRTSGAPVTSPSPSSDVPSTAPLSDELPTRLVVPSLEIDLPVVSGDLTVPGNPPDYPLCDVAQYLTIFRYPGRPATTTWIYGHARPRMLLPLLEASMVDNGAALIGGTVVLYSDAAQRFTYRISAVLRHAIDRGAARDVPPASRRLVLQTSEGPRGTVPKLQIVAELESVAGVALTEATPPASPKACFEG